MGLNPEKRTEGDTAWTQREGGYEDGTRPRGPGTGAIEGVRPRFNDRLLG